MLVILRENVENLGITGDLVKVSDGYARNFLLPRKLVLIADEKNVATIEHNKRLLEKKRAAQKVDSETLAKKLEQYSCTISRKVGDQDRLFGSVSAGDITTALKAAGFAVDKRSVFMDAPIKSLGAHTVTVKLQPEVSATLKVSVVKED
jgi:large subunit ribosomal protein L9